MALVPIQQAADIIAESSSILIAPTSALSGDALSGAFGLGKALEDAGKESCVLLPVDVPQRFSFLPRPAQTPSQISVEREYVLTVRAEHAPIRDIRYEETDGAVKFYLTTSGLLSGDHVRVEGGPHKHDLIIAVGATDAESLGSIFENQPHLLSEIPLLNIDHHSSNERYGDVNLVDITAATTSEIVCELLDLWDAQRLTEDVSTCLLAGIVDGTRSFQDVSVTPKTLNIAARLVGLGARQTEVTQHLYKSHSIRHLKLWGLLLHRLKMLEERHIAHATLTPEDLAECSCDTQGLPLVLEDFHAQFPHFATIALFFLRQDNGAAPHTSVCVCGLVSSSEPDFLERVSRCFSTVLRQNIASFRINVPVLAGAADEFIERCVH